MFRRLPILSILSAWDVILSKAFLKLFFSLFFLIILPYAIFISSFLYSTYTESLDWNYRFQLTRVQLLSIDLENHIRDQLSIQSQEKTHYFSGSIDELENFVSFKNCNLNLENLLEGRERTTFLFSCKDGDRYKNWIALIDRDKVWIYSSGFLEDQVLETPFSEPNETIFISNASHPNGISSIIEEDFSINSDWKKLISPSLGTEERFPKIREVVYQNETYFLSGFPMYGLPFQVFVASPKESVLIPIRKNLIKNTVFLVILVILSIGFSAWIAGRELEDKRKLSIIFQEFPHAAALFDLDGEVLLINPNLESKISIKNLHIAHRTAYDVILKQVMEFLENAKNEKKTRITNRKEEWEAANENGVIYHLEVQYHLWYLENKSNNNPRGALILIQDITEKKLVFEKEMSYARNLQNKYLPQKRIEIPELNYDYHYQPLIQVGGDYYDFLNLGDDRYIFVIGDIVGHGVQAAMMMTVVRVLFHQIVKETNDPNEILTKLNSGVRNNLPDAYSFVPLMFLCFDFQTKKIQYGNAGHPGMIRISQGIIECPERLNPMLGMLPSFSPKVLELPIIPGDRYYLFTDGLRDVRNTRKEELGDDELISLFVKLSFADLATVKEELINKIKSFAQGATYPDDITWIGLEIK
ncbi:SpoIIE family protein phosphatase [Leptospira sp. 'Mane']|uniref:SpoIIE family protein phosphatase n=1 Tax=Leptospira sp. 'Mane' TaxID=3387407 RepID=UPI00398A544F